MSLRIEDIKPGMEFGGCVASIKEFGAFVELGPQIEALVHVSEMPFQRGVPINEVLSIGDPVKVRILSIDHQQRILASMVIATAQMGSLPIEIYLDPGDNSLEEIQGLLESISNLHVAAGGLGFTFKPDGQFLVAQAQVMQ